MVWTMVAIPALYLRAIKPVYGTDAMRYGPQRRKLRKGALSFRPESHEWVDDGGFAGGEQAAGEAHEQADGQRQENAFERRSHRQGRH